MKSVLEHLDLVSEVMDKEFDEFIKDNYEYNMDQEQFTDKLNQFYIQEQKSYKDTNFIKDYDNIEYTNKNDMLELTALYLGVDEELSDEHQAINISDLDDTIEVIRLMHRRIVLARAVRSLILKIIKDAEEEVVSLLENLLKVADKTTLAFMSFMINQDLYSKALIEKDDALREAVVKYQRLK